MRKGVNDGGGVCYMEEVLMLVKVKEESFRGRDDFGFLEWV